ncbi:hypothetical protein LEP1GSC158_1405 [Leptospira interrogans serovar Zanoni str. LT2156]|uniref:Uncharacterized protein n=1 Tax=Leptospira interrogans serovar Zanoni str. LT2156 TaxID=1001601 RepID=M6HHJ2_LEPIR|nr:hypothetical protein LEP1GSC158_1405 [Leptospira interrogans serovar Zanoni str. LT2156]
MGITSATQILLSTSVELKILKYAMEQFLVFLDSERLYLFKNSENAESAELYLEVKDPSLETSEIPVLQSIVYNQDYSRWKKFFHPEVICREIYLSSPKTKKIFRSKRNLFGNFNPPICFRRMVWICRI